VNDEVKQTHLGPPAVTWIAGDPIWIGLLIDAVMIAVVALTFFLLWLIS
jgi:hypothetical protein